MKQDGIFIDPELRRTRFNFDAEPLWEDEVEARGYTKEQRQKIWNRYALKTARQEEVFKKLFSLIFNEQKKTVIDNFDNTGNLPDSLDDESTAKRLEEAIKLIYEGGYQDALPKQFDLLDEHALEWIATRSLFLARSINTTTLNGLRLALHQGYTEGESIQELRKRLEGYFTDGARMRAERIARTEVIAANNEGALHRYEVAGMEKSEWMAAPDSCEECIAEDGNQYPITEASGKIPKHPNCRCTWLAVV